MQFFIDFILLFVEFCVYLRDEIKKHNIKTHMKELAKYSGVIVMFIGVAFLAIPFLMGTINNNYLLLGLILVVEGFLGHIYVNNMKKGSVASSIFWAIFLLIVPFFLFTLAKKAAYSKDEFALYN